MTSMSRITYSQLGQNSLRGIQGNLERLGKSQDQLSTGLAFSRASENPIGTASAMSYRSDMKQYEQYKRNADDGATWLQESDSALGSALDLINRANDLVLQGKSTGSGSGASREALAKEVEQLREGLLNIANTTYLGRPIFGGTTGGSVAFNADGTFAGDANPVTRSVGRGVDVQVNTDGRDAFGGKGGAPDVFKLLQDVAANLRTDPDALGGDLDDLKAVHRNVTDTLADIGARANRIDNMRQAAIDRVLATSNSLNDVIGTDMVESTINLQMQKTAYEAALGTAGKVLQLSLTSFLR